VSNGYKPFSVRPWRPPPSSWREVVLRLGCRLVDALGYVFDKHGGKLLVSGVVLFGLGMLEHALLESAHSAVDGEGVIDAAGLAAGVTAIGGLGAALYRVFGPGPG